MSYSEIPSGYLTTRDSFGLRSAYNASKLLKTELPPREFEDLLPVMHEALRRERRRRQFDPLIARLKQSPDIRRAFVAHFAFTPPGQYRENRPHEHIREHPLRVANLLCILRLDDRAIIGALLHDDVEDGRASRAIIKAIFGFDVANDVMRYSIPGRQKLEKLFAFNLFPHRRKTEENLEQRQRAQEQAESESDRVLKIFYKDTYQLPNFEWRGTIGKASDTLANLEDDALDAKNGVLSLDFENLQRKNRNFNHSFNALIDLFQELYPGEEKNCHDIISQMYIWGRRALATREEALSFPRNTIGYRHFDLGSEPLAITRAIEAPARPVKARNRANGKMIEDPMAEPALA